MAEIGFLARRLSDAIDSRDAVRARELVGSIAAQVSRTTGRTLDEIEAPPPEDRRSLHLAVALVGILADRARLDDLRILVAADPNDEVAELAKALIDGCAPADLPFPKMPPPPRVRVSSTTNSKTLLAALHGWSQEYWVTLGTDVPRSNRAARRRNQIVGEMWKRGAAERAELITLLHSTDAAVRFAVATALFALGAPEARTPLIQFAKGPRGPAAALATAMLLLQEADVPATERPGSP